MEKKRQDGQLIDMRHWVRSFKCNRPKDTVTIQGICFLLLSHILTCTFKTSFDLSDSVQERDKIPKGNVNLYQQQTGLNK